MIFIADGGEFEGTTMHLLHYPDGTVLSPLSLYRHGADGDFELIWPERVSFPADDTESFICRDHDVLYFSKWYEDPDYREEINVRSARTGEIIRHFPGTLYEMPNGIWWQL